VAAAEISFVDQVARASVGRRPPFSRSWQDRSEYAIRPSRLGAENSCRQTAWPKVRGPVWPRARSTGPDGRISVARDTSY
jgi:hypothetical protein